MSEEANQVPENGDSPANRDSSKQTQDDLASKMPKIISFDQLARCGDEIWIECNGQIYRLRRTRQGKLILNK